MVGAFSDGITLSSDSPAYENCYYPALWARKLRRQSTAMATQLVSGIANQACTHVSARGRGGGEADRVGWKR